MVSFMSAGHNVVLVVLLFSISRIVNESINEAYMDEIYHLPQACTILSGDFVSWNPKITTFPGLYYVTYLVSTIISFTLKSSLTCKIDVMRLINVVFGYLLYCCVRWYRSMALDIERKQQFDVISVIIFMYPINFFYYFLYYTDSLSTLAVMAIMSFVRCRDRLRRSKKSFASLQMMLLNIFICLLCFLAILARQTNVVWVLFAAALDAVDLSLVFVPSDCAVSSFGKLAATMMQSMWKHRFAYIWFIFPMIVPVIAFIVVIFWTGSLVLGDQENHIPAVHLAMPLYCLSILFVLLYGPMAVANIIVCKSYLSFRKWMYGITLQWRFHTFGSIVASLVSYYFSFSHPFILSDNRHYMFYIWRRCLAHDTYRIFLGPIYWIAACTVINSLSSLEARLSLVRNRINVSQHEQIVQTTRHQFRQIIWTVLYVGATIASSVPTQLLEPRYFSVAITMALIQFPKDLSAAQKFVAYLVLIGESVVSFVFLYIFVSRPFIWHDKSIARFMP